MHYTVIQPRHRLDLYGNNLVVDVRAESRSPDLAATHNDKLCV